MDSFLLQQVHLNLALHPQRRKIQMKSLTVEANNNSME